jgi:hypothetical protein
LRLVWETLKRLTSPEKNMDSKNKGSGDVAVTPGDSDLYALVLEDEGHPLVNVTDEVKALSELDYGAMVRIKIKPAAEIFICSPLLDDKSKAIAPAPSSSDVRFKPITPTYVLGAKQFPRGNGGEMMRYYKDKRFFWMTSEEYDASARPQSPVFLYAVPLVAVETWNELVKKARD